MEKKIGEKSIIQNIKKALLEFSKKNSWKSNFDSKWNFQPFDLKNNNLKFTWKLNIIEISTIFNISENGEICVKYCRYEKYWFMAVWAERFFKKCH